MHPLEQVHLQPPRQREYLRRPFARGYNVLGMAGRDDYSLSAPTWADAPPAAEAPQVAPTPLFLHEVLGMAGRDDDSLSASTWANAPPAAEASQVAPTPPDTKVIDVCFTGNWVKSIIVALTHIPGGRTPFIQYMPGMVVCMCIQVFVVFNAATNIRIHRDAIQNNGKSSHNCWVAGGGGGTLVPSAMFIKVLPLLSTCSVDKFPMIRRWWRLSIIYLTLEA